MHSDFRQALRGLLRDRAFTAMVVLSLAVGIGANTAIFSLVNGILLRPPDFREPDRLVSAAQVIPRFAKLYPTLPLNIAIWQEWRKQAKSLEGIAIMKGTSFSLTGAGDPELVPGAVVSANVFGVLGVPPRLGRAFLESEEPDGHDGVVILADSLWRRRFHQDASVIGRKVLVNGHPMEVAGVMPASFRFPTDPRFAPATGGKGKIEIFKPLGYRPDEMVLHMGDFNYSVVARLGTGVPAARALAELNVIQAGISGKIPDNLDLHADVVPLAEQMVGRSRQGLLLMMAAVGAVLMILWVNLANLSLVRAAGRARDSAIRTALGAGRGPLVRQALVESMALALTGGGLGVALAYGGLKALLAAAPIDLPRIEAVRVDVRVLLFALGVSLLAGLILGVLPALGGAAAPFEALKSGSRGSTEGRRGRYVRNLLVSLEVGLSGALLVTAGLLTASFVRVMTVDKGFEVQRIIAVDMALPSTKYPKSPERAAFYQRVMDKAAAMPGVESLGLVSALPLEGESWIDIVGTEHDPRPLLEKPSTNVRFISPGYFQTLRITLREGRTFEEQDRRRNVTVISNSLAQRLWPGQSPIGRKMGNGDETLEVVGVTPDLRSTSLDHEPVNMMYLPYWLRTRSSSSLLVRTAMDPRGISGALRAAIWSIDSEVPVPEIRTLEQVQAQSVGERRFQMLLVALFAAAALALAAFGTYGVVSYSVARRRAEMGIRMALGAGRGSVLGMVLRQGMMPVAAGLAAGIVAALALGRYVASLLFQVSPRDPVAFVVAGTVLLMVSAAACLIPARRATRVNPIEALRFE